MLVCGLSFPLPAGLAGAACGDNHIDGDEQCDGTDLGGLTCTDLTGGFVPPGQGTLTCKDDCTFDARDCLRLFVEGLLPAKRPPTNRCQLEWGTVGTSPESGSAVHRVCRDGDPTCDQDRDVNLACRIRIELCLNVLDDRIGGCSAARIARLEVLRPKPRSRVAAEMVSGILTAASNAGPDQAHVRKNGVSFRPPVNEFSCGTSTVSVPARRLPGHARPGKVRFTVRTSDDSGRVHAVAPLVLICRP